MSETASFREAVLIVIKEAEEPLHYREITKRITSRRLVETQGRTVENTVNRVLNELVGENLVTRHGDGLYAFGAPTVNNDSPIPPVSMVNEAASGGPRRGDVRFFTILLTGTTTDDLNDVLRNYSDTSVDSHTTEPGVTVTVDGHAYTDTGKTRGAMTLAHLRDTGQGIVIASRVAAVTSTVGRLFRTSHPLVSYHGAGYATRDGQFYVNPLYPNPDYPSPDSYDPSTDTGFVVHIDQSDEPVNTVYTGTDPDDAASTTMEKVAGSGWFNEISALPKNAFSTTFNALDKEVGRNVAMGLDTEPNQDVSDEEAFTEALRSDLSIYKNVLLEGVAGSGKSHSLHSLIRSYDEALPTDSASRVEFVVFHPSSTYEDFVRGLRVTASPDGLGTQFAIEDGLFLDMCQRAWSDPTHNYLLFIDEINRANTARVLGDLLYAMEKSKRVTVSEILADSSGSALSDVRDSRSVRLLTADDTHPRYLRVPENLHILGTMNSTDRSVGSLDLALQRRFRRLVKEPLGHHDLLHDLAQESLPNNSDTVDTADINERVADLAWWLEEMNARLHDYVGPDARIGHSYFFSTPAPREGATEGIIDEYIESVSRAVVDQLCEIARMFGLNQTTLDIVQSTQETDYAPHYWVHLTGAGLGQSPEVVDFDEEWFVEDDDADLESGE
ncbi:MAG TPA: AAA family ATPase [Candidatus Corynebacterium avicola]|uniref:AAA family ATPase n=1 Tax=Candidatus Corynebacterium avicola TaxID=2838527 RepID=A0A9D1RPV8_9CORY|nr:AAA family ATPase [Candidatus Corynebacterium avicola]